MKQLDAQIITFPANKIVRMVPDEVKEVIKDRNKKQEADAITNMIASDLLYGFGSLDNFDATSKTFQKDFAYAVEALRSAIYRSMGLQHMFHEMIDTAVEVAANTEVAELIKDYEEEIGEEI